jgi:lipopolysaccharide transport system permease protein
MNENKWDLELTSNNKTFDLKIKQVLKYKDLLFLLVWRDVISFYKQTILGPVWFFIQPIFTTIIFTFIFGNVAKLSTEGVPGPLYYLLGITSWNYFSDCLIKTSTTFKDNVSIFGKVYFPRIIMPLSIVFSNLLKFLIQLFLFLILYIFYSLKQTIFPINFSILLFPFFILLMAMQGLGFGMIITAMTTKYKDLSYLVAFGVQLMMYTTTIIFPLSSLSGYQYWVIALNPMTFVIEGIKHITIGVGVLSLQTILYSFSASIIILFSGVLIFNKVEKNFVDTI